MHIYYFFLFFFSFPLNIFVSLIFIDIFPNWHLALVLFSSFCLVSFVLLYIIFGFLCSSSHSIILYFCWTVGTPLQYSCLENLMDRGAWWAAVHGVTKSRTRLTALSLFTFMHCRRKWKPTPVFLPGESQGWGSLMGCRLWGHTESDTTEVT